MGRMWIQGFLDQGVNQDEALRLHLRRNHYPPVHLDFMPAAKEAIEHCNADDPFHEITMCNGKTLTA